MNDSTVTFTVKNNDPFLKLSITKISLIHITAVDITTEVEVSSQGKSYNIITPRENLGSYTIDLSTHETKLTKSSDVIFVNEGSSGNFIFNFKVDTTKSHGVFGTTSLTDMLKTDWLKSKLVVKYVGKGKIYLLSADLKVGTNSKESVSLDF